MVVVPYVMPGFGLAKAVTSAWPASGHEPIGRMVLLNHGLFTFGVTTKSAYHDHLRRVTRAERRLDAHAPIGCPSPDALPEVSPIELAELRRRISEAAGRPMVMTATRRGPGRASSAVPIWRAWPPAGLALPIT